MSIRTTFDKITSNNSESWSLALFWIVIFEILATRIESSFVHQTPDIMMHIPDGVYSEIIISEVSSCKLQFL